jgi:hypothetical protein
VTPETMDDPHEVISWGAIVDLVAFHPRHPARWALRVGAAEWLGCCEPQYLDPPPVRIWRLPLDWLRADCTGLVILSQEPVDAYRVLSGLHSITAEDAAHAGELRRVLSRSWLVPHIGMATGGMRHVA